MISSDFNKTALENSKYKTILAAFKFTEKEINEYNSKRIISECNKNPKFESCFHLKAYCVRDFLDKKLPEGMEKTIKCFRPENRPYCGESFQTDEGIEANINTYTLIDKKIKEIKKAINQKPIAQAYLSDINDTFKKFSERVQQAIKDGKMAIEDAKKKEALKMSQEYQKDKNQIKNLGDACKIFENCSAYLKDAGREDNRKLIEQVSSCTNFENTIKADELENFKQIMKAMQGKENTFRKEDSYLLVNTAYQESLQSSAAQYLKGFFAINKKMPTRTSFCEKMKGCDEKLNALYSTVSQSSSQLPTLDRKNQTSIFNNKVDILNQSCKESISGLKENPNKRDNYIRKINQAYTSLINESPFGNLLAIGQFQEIAGKFSDKDCLNSGSGLRKIDENSEKLTEALNQSLEILASKVRELKSEKNWLTDPDDPYSGLRYFLEYDPLTLRNILRKTNDPGMASLICYEIDKIYKKEKNLRIVSGALTGLAITGSVVATVLTFGAASPTLIGSLSLAGAISAGSVAVGLGTGVVNYAQSKEQETLYEQSVVAGSFDRQVGRSLIEQYNFQANAELVGIAASFAPFVGRGLVTAAGKTSAAASIQLKANALRMAINSSPSWTKTAQLTKPVINFLSKAKNSTVSLAEMQIALASKVMPKTSKVMIETFNAIAKGMPEDAAMIFGVHALSHPDPYSDEGILDCLESLIISRGIAALGANGRAYLQSKRQKSYLDAASNLEVGKPVAVMNSDNSYSNAKIISIEPDNKFMVYFEKDGINHRMLVDFSKIKESMPLSAGHLKISQEVSIPAPGGVVNGRVIGIDTNGKISVEVNQNGKKELKVVEYRQVMDPVEIKQRNQSSNGQPRKFVSKKIEDYVSRGGQKIEINLQSEELREAVDKSIEIIKVKTGYSPGAADIGNPKVRKSIYEAWIKHVAPTFEHKKKDGEYYGALRDRILDEGGGTADLGKILKQQGAVCRELSLAGSIVFSEFGIKTKVVTGNVSINGPSPGGHAWIEDYDGVIIDNNYLKKVVPDFDKYKEKTNGAEIIKSTIPVEP